MPEIVIGRASLHFFLNSSRSLKSACELVQFLLHTLPLGRKLLLPSQASTQVSLQRLKFNPLYSRFPWPPEEVAAQFLLSTQKPWT